MTPWRLEAKQLSNPVIAVRYDKLRERQDWSSLYAWKELIRLLSGAQDPGVLRRGVDVLDDEPLAGFVATHLRCPEATAAAAIQALDAMGLLRADDDALALPVAVTRGKGVIGAVSDRGGRPRSGETREQAAERRVAERAQREASARAQGHLKMPIAGRLAAGNSENSEVRFSGGVSPEVSVGGYGLENPVSGSPVSSRESGTVVVENNHISTIKRVDSCLSVKQQQTSARARETGNSETGFPDEVSAVPVSEEAKALAAELAEHPKLARKHESDGPAIVQEFIARVGDAAKVRAIALEALARRQSVVPVNSVRWFADFMIPTAGEDGQGSRLPEDWNPSRDDRELAVRLGLKPDQVLDRFRDYWRSQPGPRGQRADWAATWRNWCRKDADGRPTVAQHSSHKPGKLDWAIEELRQRGAGDPGPTIDQPRGEVA